MSALAPGWSAGLSAHKRYARLRAAVAADGYSVLYYADQGTLPAYPGINDPILGMLDQSSNSRNVTFGSGDRPTFILDGGAPCWYAATCKMAA